MRIPKWLAEQMERKEREEAAFELTFLEIQMLPEAPPSES
jgi:hypothetical protein